MVCVCVGVVVGGELNAGKAFSCARARTSCVSARSLFTVSEQIHTHTHSAVWLPGVVHEHQLHVCVWRAASLRACARATPAPSSEHLTGLARPTEPKISISCPLTFALAHYPTGAGVQLLLTSERASTLISSSASPPPHLFAADRRMAAARKLRVRVGAAGRER